MLTKKIQDHFREMDPILFSALEKTGEIPSSSSRSHLDYFEHLCADIVGQQLSGRVADVIWGRFIQLFPKQKITPEKILKLKDEQIRAVGTSNTKVKYLKDLAQKVVDKKLELKNLDNLPDSEVILQLTQVKGIGPWTAEMFLMFTLKRENIFSFGDLGLKNAIKKLYRLENPTRQEIEEIVCKWEPFKTYACRILWQSLKK